jgi:NAD(P)-dependent dehydrogenase (short-subunit alcohol dehydrogenase family)
MSSKASTLRGRTALITGASRGIGRAMAVLFAEQGANVIVTARTSDALADVVDEITTGGGHAVAVPADVMTDDAGEVLVAQSLAAFGRLDVLVNNAGGNSFMSPVATMRFSGWQKIFALNLDSTVRIIQAALPSLVASGNGSIINVSSVTGLRGSPLMAHYGASKAAIISLTQSLAIEVATEGVRVNALVPGWIETDLTEFLRADAGVEDTVIGRVPMGRWGTADEIARGALFLASDASSFMTGQSLVIDGGLSAQP